MNDSTPKYFDDGPISRERESFVVMHTSQEN